MTNYERIKNMSVEEMTEQISTWFLACLNAVCIELGQFPPTLSEEEFMELKQGRIKWLESEVEE